MIRRLAAMYGLLAVFAMLLSTAVAWACALWSPLAASRSLPEAEAAEFLTDGLGVTTFASRPGGIQHSGIGVTFTLACDATLERPTRAQVLARPSRLRPNVEAFKLIPGGPNDKSIGVIRAGWPLPCLEGATKSIGPNRALDGVIAPPRILDNLGVKPRRMLPLYLRWTGMTVNTVFYCAVFWPASHDRRARGDPLCAVGVQDSENRPSRHLRVDSHLLA
ncbi:MAG: hypothetical protein E2O40_07465 [Planctomycetota bacterium]|nr:MAG: hypothetical protein E2O40_07465 [Planctomycetota bacterium]